MDDTSYDKNFQEKLALPPHLQKGGKRNKYHLEIALVLMRPGSYNNSFLVLVLKVSFSIFGFTIQEKGTCKKYSDTKVNYHISKIRG